MSLATLPAGATSQRVSSFYIVTYFECCNIDDPSDMVRELFSHPSGGKLIFKTTTWNCERLFVALKGGTWLHSLAIRYWRKVVLTTTTRRHFMIKRTIWYWSEVVFTTTTRSHLMILSDIAGIVLFSQQRRESIFQSELIARKWSSPAPGGFRLLKD